MSVVIASPSVGLGAALEKVLRQEGQAVERMAFHGNSKWEKPPEVLVLEVPWFAGQTAAWCMAQVEAWLLAAPRARVVLLSTGLVYGQPLREPVMEVDPIFPVELAGMSAAVVEQAILFNLRNGLREGAVVRLGELCPLGAQVGTWVHALESEGVVKDWPKGRTTASVLDTKVAVHCVRALLKPLPEFYPHPSFIYNLASAHRPLGMVLRDLADCWGKKKLEINEVEGKYLPLAAITMDCSAARGHLGLPQGASQLSHKEII